MESVDPTIDLLYRSLDLIGVALNGMVRDVTFWQFSSVFGGNPLYAVPASFASAAMVVFAEAGLIGLGMVVAPILGTGLAILAYWFEWVLPRGINYVPVNYAAAQMAAAVKTTERRGFKLGSNGTNNKAQRGTTKSRG